MLLETWLDQPTLLMAVLLAAFFLATGLAVQALVFAPPARGFFAALGVVAPFFGAVSVLFGLMTGFVAGDAWERTRLAGRAVIAERDAVTAIQALSIATVSDMAPIRRALRAYAASVVGDEWPRMEDGEAAPETAAALADLLRELADPHSSVQSGLVAHSALLDLGMRLVAARGDRLNLAGQRTSHAKWWAVIGLAVLTQFAIALVHAGKPRAGAVTVAVFSLAAVLALSLVAVFERPFDGASGLRPAAMRAALDLLSPPPAP